MATEIQLRRGTAAQWATANPVLAQGELGVELDTSKVKCGDGTTAWTGLPYSIGATGPQGAPGVVQSITAADNSVVVGGTATVPTVSAAAAITEAVAPKAPIDSPTFTTSVTLPADPTEDLEAVTKQYADAGVATAALKANNLSDLASAPTALKNLGGIPLAKTQTAASETVWSYTPNQPSTPGDFASYVNTETYGTSPAVTETTLRLGYNLPGHLVQGESQGYLEFLPDCGDTDAFELGFSGAFPDGTPYTGFQLQASYTGNNRSRWTWRFQKGSDLSGYLTIGDDINFYLKATPAATVGGATVALSQANTNLGDQSTVGTNLRLHPSAGGNTIWLLAPAGSSNAIEFFQGATTNWIFYDAGSSSLHIRDAVNGVPALTFVQGAGVNGQVQAGSVFVPVQATTTGAPTYVKGGVYFDTTLNKLRVGGATAWETVTSS